MSDSFQCCFWWQDLPRCFKVCVLVDLFTRIQYRTPTEVEKQQQPQKQGTLFHSLRLRFRDHRAVPKAILISVGICPQYLPGNRTTVRDCYIRRPSLVMNGRICSACELCKSTQKNKIWNIMLVVSRTIPQTFQCVIPFMCFTKKLLQTPHKHDVENTKRQSLNAPKHATMWNKLIFTSSIWASNRGWVSSATQLWHRTPTRA